MIVPELHAIQHTHGFLPERELRALAARTGTKLHRIQEVASFYPHFKLEKPATVQLKVCQDMSCQMRGACETLATFEHITEIEGVSVEVKPVSCLGRCDRAPVAYISTMIVKKNTDSETVYHENVSYHAPFDESIEGRLRDAVRAAASGDESSLPAGQTDIDWCASEHANWTIDPYGGFSNQIRYKAVKDWIHKNSQNLSIEADQFRLNGSEIPFTSVHSNLGPISDHDYSDTPIVICIWQSDCDVSRANLNSAIRLQRLFGGRPKRSVDKNFVNEGLNFVGFNINDDKSAVEAVCAELKIDWPQVTGRDAKAICKKIGINGAPAVILLGPDGKVIGSETELEKLDVPTQKMMLESGLRAKLDEDMVPESQRILASLFTANLLGMGGAGGRAYKKWFEVYQAKGDRKFVVCNGDESEPGTFKDREILLRTPHLVVEAVILAGLILGAERGYIYIRHEFEEQIQAVRDEIERAEEMGVCGKFISVGDSDQKLSFPVEVFVSPGGYICGEQTALIEAMENKRAEPRNRPPELQTNGLWDCPTLLNNVETLAWIPSIVLKENGKWFAEAGTNLTKRYKGRRFFSISGDVRNPGVYEVPIGLTLGQLIEDYAGGIKDAEDFKAVALSGPSGGFLPRQIPVEFINPKWVERKLPKSATHLDVLDIELDIGECRQIGIMMGAGIVIFGESADMVESALSASIFYRNESCGKCVPCRIGSQKIVELVTDIRDGKFSLEQIYGESENGESRQQQVDALTEAMQLTAICGLGTVASNPLATLLNHFKSDVQEYTKN